MSSIFFWPLCGPGSKGSEGSEGKVDGATPRGLWPPAGGGLCSLRSGGDSAYGAEGGGLPLCGNSYKVSVTGFTFLCHRA